MQQVFVWNFYDRHKHVFTSSPGDIIFCHLLLMLLLKFTKYSPQRFSLYLSFQQIVRSKPSIILAQNQVKMVTVNYFTNETDSSQTPFQYELWLISLVMNFTLLSIGVWMVANIGIYGIRSKKFRRNKKKTLSEHLLLKVLFITAILMIPRILTTQALLWVGYEPRADDGQCNLLNHFTVGLYWLGFFPVCLFWWLRQRSLYLQPSLIRLYTKPLQVLSWGCIIFVFFFEMLAALGMIVMSHYEATKNGCREIEDNYQYQAKVHYYLAATLVISELTLLALFIYPLKRHHKSAFTSKQPVCRVQAVEVNSAESYFSSDDKIYRSSADKSTSSSGEQFNYSVFSTNKKKSNNSGNHDFSRAQSCKTNKRIVRVMRRSVVCASVCIVSDVLSFVVVTLFLPPNLVRSFRNSLHDLNLIINLVTLLVTFEKYEYITTAMIRKPPQKLSTNKSINLRGLAPGLHSSEETSQRWRVVGDTSNNSSR